MTYFYLPSLGAMALSGPDARKFLQGQLTCDIEKLTPSYPLKGAHCNRQGRVMALYDLIDQGDRILLITQKELLEDAIAHLKHYGMFSKLKWEALPENQKIEGDLEGHLRCLSSDVQKPESKTEHDETAWYYHKIKRGEVFLSKDTVGQFLPQELGLHGDALSFTKGCYLGQEIIARLHYLGKLKYELKHIERVHPLKPLDEIEEESKKGKVISAVRYHHQYYALALISRD